MTLRYPQQRTIFLIGGISIIFFAVYFIFTTSGETTTSTPRHEGCTATVLKPIFAKTKISKDFVVHKYLNIFNASEENEAERHSIDSNKCVPLNTTLGKTPICVYDPKIDEWVSDYIVEGGMWERDIVYMMASFLAENPNMELMDLGSNVGVYTLQAAKMGRKVTAVDANLFNLRLLSKSLHLGELQKRTTLVWNAITDVHETINLTITTGNIGASFVSAEGVIPKERLNFLSQFEKQPALAITLEDLIGFVKENPIFMKIDIEGSEWKAFRGGETFFQEVDVRFILMEWWTYMESNGCEVIRYLSRFGFQPYVAESRPLLNKLNINTFYTWPNDILWIKE